MAKGKSPFEELQDLVHSVIQRVHTLEEQIGKQKSNGHIYEPQTAQVWAKWSECNDSFMFSKWLNDWYLEREITIPTSGEKRISKRYCYEAAIYAKEKWDRWKTL